MKTKKVLTTGDLENNYLLPRPKDLRQLFPEERVRVVVGARTRPEWRLVEREYVLLNGVGEELAKVRYQRDALFESIVYEVGEDVREERIFYLIRKEPVGKEMKEIDGEGGLIKFYDRRIRRERMLRTPEDSRACLMEMLMDVGYATSFVEAYEKAKAAIP